MPEYLRSLVPGGTFFFTITLPEGRRKLLTEPLDNLRVSLMAARDCRPFTVEAIVILADRRLGVWGWNDAKGGMRCAFPPYGPTVLRFLTISQPIQSINQAGASPQRAINQEVRSAINGQLYELIQAVALSEAINHYRPDLISLRFC